MSTETEKKIVQAIEAAADGITAGRYNPSGVGELATAVKDLAEALSSLRSPEQPR